MPLQTFDTVIHQGLSLSGKTSYRKISWSLEAAGFGFKLSQSLWNLAGTSAALLPRCLSNFRAIRPLQHPISRLRDFTRFGSKTSYRLVNRGPGQLQVELRPGSGTVYLRMYEASIWIAEYGITCIHIEQDPPMAYFVLIQQYDVIEKCILFRTYIRYIMKTPDNQLDHGLFFNSSVLTWTEHIFINGSLHIRYFKWPIFTEIVFGSQDK